MISPSVREMTYYEICQDISLFSRKETVSIPNKTIKDNVALFLAERYQITETAHHKLILAACINENIDQFNYHLEKSNWLLNHHKTIINLWNTAISIGSLVMVKRIYELKLFSSQESYFCTYLFSKTTNVNLLEWILLEIKNEELLQRHVFAHHFVTLCSLENTSDEDLETLKRITKIVKHFNISIKAFTASTAPMVSRNGAFAAWLITIPLCTIYLERQNAKTPMGVEYSQLRNFVRTICANLLLTKKVFALPGVKEAWMEGVSTVPKYRDNDLDRYKYGNGALLDLYVNCPTEVIEYFWEEKLASPHDLNRKMLFCSIIMEVKKDRLLWLYSNRKMPKITDSPYTELDYCNSDWRAVKYAYEKGVFSKACAQSIITTLFSNLILIPSLLGLEWCYQTFPHIREKAPTTEFGKNISLIIESWIKNRYPFDKGIDEITKTQQKMISNISQEEAPYESTDDESVSYD